MSSFYELIDFQVHGDDNGSLVALEAGKNIPFDIKRIYYIYGTLKDVTRGKHAHKELEQVIICLSGSCDFILDNGKARETVHLDKPNRGIHIKSNVWREFTNFSADCVIMVAANMHYDTRDYIKDYDEFLGLVNE